VVVPDDDTRNVEGNEREWAPSLLELLFGHVSKLCEGCIFPYSLASRIC